MIPFGPKAKLAGLAATVVAIGYAGWMARGWFEDSKDLAAMEAQQALAEEIRKDIGGISTQVEDRLGELRANERIIDRGVIREIQKPIYKRVCFEPELVRLLNDAQRGDTSKPDGEVSRDTP
ncbi:hypothetical protein BKP64_10915 [Marinobacter salinus]|uniref:Uncharacterized protein n=1 Tax=Marinobacter salinus TaxID=1874317 RepID=A0A1D9GM11_9GAMM|nr:hypothetical protein [Marinobacter salinus]AOY88639.1 hypothetical protein BKP64_10915 [Marinobacter salinus]